MEAQRLYEAILAIKPFHFDALHLQGVTKIQQGDFETGVSFIRKALRVKPNAAQAFYNLGMALEKLGRYDEAVISFDKALKLKRNYVEALNNRGGALRALNRHEEALASYDQALMVNPDYAEALNNRGLALHELNRKEEALASYERALAIKPDFVEVIDNRGITLQFLNRHEEALASYNRALTIAPHNVGVLNNRGNALLELKRPEEALSSYERVLAITPDSAEALNNRGNALKVLMRFEEALASYERALAIRPDHAEVLNNRGVILGALKRPEEALASYDRALALIPNYASALINRGIVLRTLNRPEEALASFGQALAIEPHNADALYYRGNALQALNCHPEALIDFDRALAIKPDYVAALNNRGVTLRELKRHEEAMISFDQALAIDPDNAEAYSNKGIVFEEIGKVENARRAHQKATELSPRRGRFHRHLAAIKRYVPDDFHLAFMEELSEPGAALPEDERMELHFALGKAYVDVEQYQRSFRHLVEGNALKRRRIVYDEAAMVESFDRIRRVFTPELMRAKRGGGNPSSLPVFVIGMPRSGSTLVEQILASHNKVFGAGEIDDLGKATIDLIASENRRTLYPEIVLSVTDQQLRHLGVNYTSAVRNLAPLAERITDKMLSNFFFAGLIHLAMPNARFIHIRRNPIDTCVSCFSLLFTNGQPYAYDLGELGRYYRAYDTLMRHWRDVLPEGTMLEVEYEALTADLDAQARRIVAHCGLEWDDACLAFYNARRSVRTASASQVRQPIYRSSIGRGQRYGDLLRPLLEALGPDLASDSGPT